MATGRDANMDATAIDTKQLEKLIAEKEAETKALKQELRRSGGGGVKKLTVAAYRVMGLWRDAFTLGAITDDYGNPVRYSIARHGERIPYARNLTRDEALDIIEQDARRIVGQLVSAASDEAAQWRAIGLLLEVYYKVVAQGILATYDPTPAGADVALKSDASVCVLASGTSTSGDGGDHFSISDPFGDKPQTLYNNYIMVDQLDDVRAAYVSFKEELRLTPQGLIDFKHLVDQGLISGAADDPLRDLYFWANPSSRHFYDRLHDLAHMFADRFIPNERKLKGGFFLIGQPGYGKSKIADYWLWLYQGTTNAALALDAFMNDETSLSLLDQYDCNISHDEDDNLEISRNDRVKKYLAHEMFSARTAYQRQAHQVRFRGTIIHCLNRMFDLRTSNPSIAERINAIEIDNKPDQSTNFADTLNPEWRPYLIGFFAAVADTLMESKRNIARSPTMVSIVTNIKTQQASPSVFMPKFAHVYGFVQNKNMAYQVYSEWCDQNLVNRAKYTAFADEFDRYSSGYTKKPLYGTRCRVIELTSNSDEVLTWTDSTRDMAIREAIAKIYDLDEPPQPRPTQPPTAPTAPTQPPTPPVTPTPSTPTQVSAQAELAQVKELFGKKEPTPPQLTREYIAKVNKTLSEDDVTHHATSYLKKAGLRNGNRHDTMFTLAIRLVKDHGVSDANTLADHMVKAASRIGVEVDYKDVLEQARRGIEVSTLGQAAVRSTTGLELPLALVETLEPIRLEDFLEYREVLPVYADANGNLRPLPNMRETQKMPYQEWANGKQFAGDTPDGIAVNLKDQPYVIVDLDGESRETMQVLTTLANRDARYPITINPAKITEGGVHVSAHIIFHVNQGVKIPKQSYKTDTGEVAVLGNEKNQLTYELRRRDMPVGKYLNLVLGEKIYDE